MEYLGLDSIRARQEDIRRALDEVFATRAVVGRPKARQWAFFRAVVESLLGVEPPEWVVHLPTTRAAQYKFEVEDRLRRHALRVGPRPEIVFRLAHRRELHGLGLPARYPGAGDYVAIVRRLEGPGIGAGPVGPYLERVVAEATSAEFRAYQSLPEYEPQALDDWFVPESPAWRQVFHVLERHRERGWVLTNPMNPSTQRLMSVKVSAVGVDEAIVNTTEYWYLRWWDSVEGSYTYPYRETNRQRYVLVREPERWRVVENQRPPPRSSSPNRWWK
jgi:hypothetical protein